MSRTRRIILTRTLTFAFLASTLYATHPTSGPRTADLPTIPQVVAR